METTMNINNTNFNDFDFALQVSDTEVTDIISNFDKGVAASDPYILSEAGALFLQDIGRTKPLSKDELVKQFKLMNSFPYDSDQYIQIRNNIAEANIKLVASVAYHNRRRGVSFFDLIQEGNFGLFEAIKKFDTSYNVTFSTYAYNWIKAKVDLAILKFSNQIRIPTWINALLTRLNKIERELSHKLSLSPDDVPVSFIAEEMKVDSQMVEDLRAIRYQNVSVTHIDALTANNNPDDDPVEFADTHQPSAEEQLLMEEDRRHIREAVNSLKKETYRDIINSSFGLETGVEESLMDIGRRRGITREAVRQSRERALEKLRQTDIKKYIQDLKQY